MNYELLKLSKILPTINGRRTLDIYQERLDMARRAQQAQQEEQEADAPSTKSGFKPYEHQRANGERANRPKREIKLSEVKSAGRLPTKKAPEAASGYSNLNALLNDDEPFESLANLVGNSFKKKQVKTTVAARTSNGNFFGKKTQVDVSTPTRPSTMAPGAPSNFVFKKKKVLLRDTNELDHIYHYSLGTGFTVLTDDALGLNGRKVGVEELDQVMFIRQQKKYLKDMKIDPMTTFHSPYRDAEGFPQVNDEKMYASATNYKTPPHQKVQDLKAQASPQQLSKEDSNLKMKTVTLDGTYLKSFDKVTPRLSNPNSPEKTLKGFF